MKNKKGIAQVGIITTVIVVAVLIVGGVAYSAYKKSVTSVKVGPNGVDVRAGGVNVKTGNSGVDINAGDTSVKTGNGGVTVETDSTAVNADVDMMIVQ